MSDEAFEHNTAVDWAKAQLTPALLAQAKLAIRSLGGTITPEQLAVYSLVVGRRARDEALEEAVAIVEQTVSRDTRDETIGRIRALLPGETGGGR